MKVLDKDNNELNLDQLDKINGGTSPRYPAGTDTKKNLGSVPILNGIGDNLPRPDRSPADKPFTVCPVCHSTAVSYNRVENICMCQDCGYCEDRSK